MDAQQRIINSLNNANEGHGRYSHWNGSETIALPLSTLRAAIAGDVASKKLIEEAVGKVKDGGCFSCWSGQNASMVTTITVSDLKELI